MVDDLDGRMREGEYFHELRVPRGMWMVLRVDGRSFSRFTERFEKPFDPRFHDLMVETARTLLDNTGGLYAYTESDEISVVLPHTSEHFDREVEKLVSTAAGLASAAFSVACGAVAHFDSRLWIGATLDDVLDYLHWRQLDSHRCALNGWAYWTLRTAGKTKQVATELLSRLDAAGKNELLWQSGVNFNEVPAWQRRGTGVYWEAVTKTGYNPVAGVEVQTTRRRITVNRELPRGPDYRRFATALLAPPHQASERGE